MHARLISTHVPRDPEGAVLVLHGGGSRGRPLGVSPTQLSVLRMIPIARSVATAGRGRLAVWRLLNTRRGWDTTHTPVTDVRWALDEIRMLLPAAVPVGLVGHSLGGRAAILAAGDEAVHSVVALNPWVYPDDGNVAAPGRQILIVHGTADRIASPARSLAAAQRLARTARVGRIEVEGGKHAMLRRHRTFDNLAAGFAAATLLDHPEVAPRGPLAEVLAGATTAVV